ncbi:putative suppressor of cytokine signaling [Trypoxylus dichotomus]
MENNSKVKLSNLKIFAIRKTKSKDANSTNVGGSNLGEKNDEKHLSEEERCSISTHNRTHKLFRSIKDKFKKNKFTICKGKQKVTASENKTNHTAFDGEESDVDPKDFTILPLFTPPLVPPRQKTSLAIGNDVTSHSLLLNNFHLLGGKDDDISLTTCSYSNYGDAQFLPTHRYSAANNLSIITYTSETPQNKLPSQDADDIMLNRNMYIDILDLDNSSNIDNQEYLNNGSFSKDFSNLRKCGYYWGPITRREAEEKLNNQPDGTFLIRDSASENHLFSLSFRSWGKTLHTRIEYSASRYSICDQRGFVTVVELIDKTMQVSRNSVYCYSRSRTPTDPVYPVRLTLPLSRFMCVRSLRHLCRFVIREHINKNDIDKLKLPEAIKSYLEEGYYW